MGRKTKELYVCKICGYKTKRKSNYENHLSRKTPCKKIKKEIDLNNTIINKEQINIKKPEELKIIKLEEKILKLTKNNKENARYKLKYEELENIHKEERKSNRDLITTNKGLMKTNQILVKDAQNLRDSIKISMTMNNYFIVNSYGNEDTSHINMNKLLEECKTLGQMIAKQIKLKHFSEQTKNHNLMLLRTIAKTYNKEGIWEPKDNVKLFIVNELIKKGIVNIDDYKKNENIVFEKNKEKNIKKIKNI